MLTGRRYESPSDGRAKGIERGEFPSALGPIADVLRRGTAREPSERMWSMADLVRTLEILRAGFLGARRRWQLGAVALLGAVGTAAITGLVLRRPVDIPPGEVVTGPAAAATSLPPRVPASPKLEGGPAPDPKPDVAAPAVSSPKPPPTTPPPDPPDDATGPARLSRPLLPRSERAS